MSLQIRSWLQIWHGLFQNWFRLTPLKKGQVCLKKDQLAAQLSRPQVPHSMLDVEGWMLELESELEWLPPEFGGRAQILIIPPQKAGKTVNAKQRWEKQSLNQK